MLAHVKGQVPVRLLIYFKMFHTINSFFQQRDIYNERKSERISILLKIVHIFKVYFVFS